jgi:acetyl esterase/lipase
MLMPDRRMILTGIAGGLIAPGTACAQAMIADIPLWPGTPPGAPTPLPVRKVEKRRTPSGLPDDFVTGISRPTLAVRRPAQPGGAAMLVIPGGAYGLLAWDNEGEEQARWLNALGVTCFILNYRLPGEGWADRSHVPLADAQRGLRLIRARAAEFGVEPARVGVLGFSAGGHLAGSLATRHAEQVYAPVDAVDRQSARPAAAGMIYPVVTMIAGITHPGSRDNLLGPSPTEAAIRAASVEARVDAETPPVFVAHAADDDVVPVANGVMMYQAMLAAKRPVEFHGYDAGGHGFGVRLPKSVPASRWPELFADFARARGVFRTA